MQRKKKILLGVTGGLLVLCLVLASFALWTQNFTQAGVNVNTFDCFDIQYVEDSDAINSLNSYPMTDEVGLNTKPYTVIMTNNCPYTVSYVVKLNKMSTTTLLSSLVRVAINDVPFSLATKQKTSTSISGANEAWVVNAGILPGNASKNIETKIWLEENTELENAKNKTFDFKISIEAQTGGGNYLAGRILSDNELKTTTPDFDVAPTDVTSGLYQMEDDDGTSYYFRGSIDNNYVSFAGLLWRIVRINGDGSIRMISEDSVGESAFNTTGRGHQYVGYTYNNTHNCTNANPCNGSEGTATTMKTYLDNWYNTNLKSYEDKIATADYCNDTSYRLGGDWRYYGAYDRINDDPITPSLACNDISVNYGGKYKLKIGLLTADEMVLAGYTRTSSITNSYLEKSSWWWSFSPYSSLTNIANVFGARSNLGNGNASGSGGVSPVINLKADTLITSGNGTVSNPYVVSD